MLAITAVGALSVATLKSGWVERYVNTRQRSQLVYNYVGMEKSLFPLTYPAWISAVAT